MIGMMFMTSAMAIHLAYAGNRFSQTGRYLDVVSGFRSLCFGVFLAYQLRYPGGLFNSLPHWIPSWAINA
jgi:hypothetical protein